MARVNSWTDKIWHRNSNLQNEHMYYNQINKTEVIGICKRSVHSADLIKTNLGDVVGQASAT